MSALLVVHSQRGGPAGGRFAAVGVRLEAPSVLQNLHRVCGLTVPLRTLPIRIRPLPGESLDSWLETIAERMDTTWGDLVEGIGLASRHEQRRRDYVAAALRGLSVSQLAAVSHCAGVDADVLQSMTFSALFDQPARGAGARSVPPSSLLWLRGFRSRYCAPCLGESGGRWLLWWRLRWAFACERHRCLLQDVCPDCQRAQRTEPAPSGLVPRPGRCTRRMPNANGRSAARCGGQLSSADSLVLDLEHPALRAQSAIRHALETGTADFGVYGQSPVTFAELIADFAAIGGRVLAYASPTELSALLPADIVGNHVEALAASSDERMGRVTAESPVSATAVAAAATWLTLAPPTTRGAADRLRWLIVSNRKLDVAVRASGLGWGRGVSAVVRGVQLAALESFLVPSDQLRYRIACRIPSANLTKSVTEQLPTLLWATWSLPLRCSGIGYPELRAGLSAAIALVGTRAPLVDIVTALGSTVTARGVLRVLQRLGASPGWNEKRWAITTYADHLKGSPPPIDYRRRRLLSCNGLLPDAAWEQLSGDVGFGAGRGLRLRLVRSWLFERLTTLPAEQSPWSIASAGFQNRLSTMSLWMTAELIDSLDEYAQTFLRDKGIHGEPVRWRPSWRPASDRDMFGVVPGLDVESLHRWIGACKPRTFAELGHKFGISAEVARAVLDESPVGSSWFGPTIGFPTSPTRMQVLTRREFDLLYNSRRWGLSRVAEHTGLSRRAVTELAVVYGIQLRPPGRPARLMR